MSIVSTWSRVESGLDGACALPTEHRESLSLSHSILTGADEEAGRANVKEGEREREGRQGERQ
jgi:hypothetical protein